MIPEKLIRLAHRRATIQQMQRDFKERYVATDGSEKLIIVCEEVVPFASRYVSEDALLDVLSMLHQLEEDITNQINRYELREREDPALPEMKERADEPVNKPARKPSKRG